MASPQDIFDPSLILEKDDFLKKAASVTSGTPQATRPIVGVSKTGARFVENFDTRRAYSSLRAKGDNELEAKEKIAVRLAGETDFDLDRALQAGFSYDDIITKLTGIESQGRAGSAFLGFKQEAPEALAAGVGVAAAAKAVPAIYSVGKQAARGAAQVAAEAGKEAMAYGARAAGPIPQVITVTPSGAASVTSKPTIMQRALNLAPKAKEAASAVFSGTPVGRTARLVGKTAKGLGYVSALVGSALGAAELSAVLRGKEEGAYPELPLEDYTSYEAGRTAGLFAGGAYPLSALMAKGLAHMPQIAPLIVTDNVTKMGQALALSPLPKVAPGPGSPFLTRMWNKARRYGAAKAQAAGAAVGAVPASVYGTGRDFLAAGAAGAKATGEHFLRNPKKYIALEVGVGAGWTPFGAMIAEEFAPLQEGPKLAAEVGMSIFYPGAFLGWGRKHAKQLFSAFGPGAREQRAADYLTGLFDELNKSGINESPEEFLKVLTSAQFKDAQGNIVELTPSQLTGSSTFKILEKYLAKTGTTYSEVQKRAAKEGHEALAGLVESLISHRKAGPVHLAADLEREMTAQTFTNWLNDNLSKAVTETEALAARSGATPGEIRRFFSAKVHTGLRDALGDARSIERGLYDKLDKKVPVVAENISATWESELPNLLKEGLTYRDIVESGVPKFLTNQMHPVRGQYDLLVSQSQTINKKIENLEQGVEGLAERGGKEDRLQKAASNYLKGSELKDLSELDKLYKAEDAFKLSIANGGAPGMYKPTRGSKERPLPNAIDRKRVASIFSNRIKIAQARQQQDELADSLLDLQRLDAPPLKESNLGELMNFRSEMLAYIRNRGAGEAVNYNTVRIYGDLADAALLDMGVAGNIDEAGNIINRTLEGMSENQINLLKAQTFSRELHDTFTRAVGGDLGVLKSTGEYKKPPELALMELFRGGADEVYLHHKELEKALTIVEYASRGTNELGSFGQFSQLLSKEARRRASVNDATKAFIRQAFMDDVVKNIDEINPATGQSIEALVIDDKAFDAFMEDYEEVFSLVGLEKLKADFEVPQRRDTLLRAYANNDPLLLDIDPRTGGYAKLGDSAEGLKIGEYWKNVERQNVWSRFLADENPTKVVGEILSESNKNTLRDYKNIVKLAQTHKSRNTQEAFRDSIIEYAMEKARTPEGYSLIKLRKVLYDTPLGNIRGQAPLMEALKRDGIVDKQFGDNFELLLTRMERVERAVEDGVDVSRLIQGGSPEYLLGLRILGAGLGRQFAAKTGMGGTVQIPGAAATFAQQYFDRMPSIMIKDILTKAATPGKEGTELLTSLLKKGRSKREEDEAIGVIGNAFGKILGVPIIALARRPLLAEDFVTPGQEVDDVFPESPPTPQSRGPVGPLMEYVPREPPPMVPSLRSMAPAPPPTAQGTTQENRARFAQMFPGDITSGLINQGIGSYRP